MLAPNIQPIGLGTPTAAVLTQLMHCVADGGCAPRTLWVDCPWHCRVPLASWLQAWRARYALGLPPMNLRASPTTDGAAPAPPHAEPENMQIRELKLAWPSDRQTEIVRIYEVRRHPPEMLIVPGAVFDLII